MIIYCCNCEEKVDCNLIDGTKAYPHRPDLKDLPFWECPQCGNFVGCHHKTKDRTRPLGVIPTPELKKWRGWIHKVLDPLWRNGDWDRRDLYKEVSKRIGWKYHTAKIRTVDEAREVYNIAKDIRDGG